MCLAIPGQVLSIEGETARVSINGVICEAGLALAEKVSVGDFVIVHAGFILRILSSDEAREDLAAIRAAIDEPEVSGDRVTSGPPASEPPAGTAEQP